MKKDIEDAFAEIFRARDETEQLASQKRQDATTREEAFRASFVDVVKRVVKPTLESLKQLLEKNGIGAMVVESEVSSGARRSEPSIGFFAFSDDARVASGTRRPSDANVQLQLSCQAQKGNVGVHECRPTAGGRAAKQQPDVTLGSLTEESIQKSVLALLQRP
jgi:hypothetical protein